MSKVYTEPSKDIKLKKNWISIGASIKKQEIDLFNRQLDNLYCKTLKDLCNLLISWETEKNLR